VVRPSWEAMEAEAVFRANALLDELDGLARP
jgi:hypothetical protein